MIDLNTAIEKAREITQKYLDICMNSNPEDNTLIVELINKNKDTRPKTITPFGYMVEGLHEYHSAQYQFEDKYIQVFKPVDMEQCLEYSFFESTGYISKIYITRRPCYYAESQYEYASTYLHEIIEEIEFDECGSIDYKSNVGLVVDENSKEVLVEALLPEDGEVKDLHFRVMGFNGTYPGEPSHYKVKRLTLVYPDSINNYFSISISPDTSDENLNILICQKTYESICIGNSNPFNEKEAMFEKMIVSRANTTETKRLAQVLPFQKIAKKALGRFPGKTKNI